MSKVVGIDLGTTNSLVAYMEGGQPQIIPGLSGASAVPSIVALHPEGSVERIVVGQAAKKSLIEGPRRTIFSVKRLMGKGIEEVQSDLKYLPFPLTGQPGEVIRIQVDEHLYTPPEVSALILTELKQRAEAHLKAPVTQAVITVPAYFNDSQRQATKDAGKIAGLEVLRIVNEPTAASLAYGLQKKKKGWIVVYDLGGGTFDVSILKIKNGIFEVLSTNGDTHLGGDDIDQCLIRLIVDEIKQQYGVDLMTSPKAFQEVRLLSEHVKCQLSSEENATISLTLPDQNIRYQREISRHTFEGLIQNLVDRTIVSCRQALEDAHLQAEEIDEVILVGGSTRIPLIKNMVADLFKQRPQSELNPDEVVALGAAIQADILAGSITDMLLLDVTPLSLGMETMGGVINRFIPRNTTIPTSAKESFTTFTDGQKSVAIHVVQGERELVKDCRSLAQFNLTGIDPLPAGMPRIEVTFLIDANGILKVSAKDLRTGKAQSIEVKPTYGLTDEDTEAMILASVEHAKKDMEARMLIETRNDADTVLRHAEKGLTQGKELIDQSERNKIEESMADLKEAMKGLDHRLIREKLGGLDGATQKLAELLMDQSVQVALKNKEIAGS
ncbi:MAG: Fe-S protein assembly chaperone HscA [Nitrospira sp.]|nr:Fe-S protein assembly chaperone HscA [Candidatus Manganitrophaceae bacterium]HIL35779.1 Fe-S protein assembly chaperone HscA [Candidatus Manganitrophaceae bacterium]